MALKKRIEKDAFDKLSKDLQANYTANGDHYILDLESDDAAELKRAKDNANRERDEAKNKLAAAEAELAKLRTGSDDPPGDKTKTGDDAIKALEAKMSARIDKLNQTNTAALAASEAKLAARDQLTRKTMIQAAADKMAADISTVPTIMSRHISDRFDVEFGDDGTAKLIVVGNDGKPSGATVEQLTKEMRGNKEFAGIIIANKASGSGAPDNSRKPSGANQRDASSPSDGNGKSDAPNPYKLQGKELGNWAKDLVASRSGRKQDG